MQLRGETAISCIHVSLRYLQMCAVAMEGWQNISPLFRVKSSIQEVWLNRQLRVYEKKGERGQFSMGREMENN